MSINFSLFPTLTEELLGKIRFQPRPYEFYFDCDTEILPLIKEQINGSEKYYKLSDENGIWNLDEYNLILKREYTIKSFSNLFGVDGIVCRNAELGLAIMWTSKSSNIRGVIDIGAIKNISDNEKILTVEEKFDVAMLRGQIDLKTIIYIKKSGNPTLKEEFLANKEGYILGILDEETIILDGNGSVFPIYEISDVNQPLWYVKCEWDNPTIDPFTDVVAIYLNRSHKSYIKYLDPKKKAYFNQQLLKEIMASALMIVILKLKESEYWNQTINGENLDRGSVSEAIYYFITTHKWDISSPDKLSITIREFLDDRML